MDHADPSEMDRNSTTLVYYHLFICTQIDKGGQECHSNKTFCISFVLGYRETSAFNKNRRMPKQNGTFSTHGNRGKCVS